MGDPTDSICRGIKQLLNKLCSERVLSKKDGRLFLPLKEQDVPGFIF